MRSTRANTISEAVEILLEHHHAVIKLPSDVVEIGNKIFAEGLKFFDLDLEAKAIFASQQVLEGYLRFGSELDKETGRPDLSESFKVWFHNASNSEVQVWAENCKFHQTMSMGLKPYASFTDSLLKALRSRIDPSYQMTDDPVVDIRSESYLQMNFSRPAKESRDTITDTHEDGHIFTIVRPTKPGFIGCPGILVESPTPQNPVGRFKSDKNLQPIEIEEDEAILVPSTPTFYLTGGLVKPLFHAVAVTDCDIRQSLIFFVNPTRGSSVFPWIRNKENRGIEDIHNVVDAINGLHLKRHGWIDKTLKSDYQT